MNKRTGFTLAEVLITLGIVGVVAALVMPGLINEYEKHVTTTRVKSFYSTISNAVLLAENENGPLETWDWVDKSPSANLKSRMAFDYIKPYLKFAVEPYYTQDYVYFRLSNGVCGLSRVNGSDMYGVFPWTTYFKVYPYCGQKKAYSGRNIFEFCLFNFKNANKNCS
ncbi:MAG: type II secretion system GspH family protein, partial [Heliobacteriaceae bacterium]|nr:type II secretion system GspH family protein [Heliobacteriaceae bacterium]